MYGVPLEQAVPIISESGDIQGNLSINIQQCTGIDSVTFTVSCLNLKLLPCSTDCLPDFICRRSDMGCG